MMRNETMNFRNSAAQFFLGGIAPALVTLVLHWLRVYLHRSPSPAGRSVMLGRVRSCGPAYRRVASRYNLAAVRSLMTSTGTSKENG
jgi:hypothetical protein